MVLEKLGDSLRAALRKIAGASYVDESLIKEIVRDIQRALIQADVNVQLALAITKQLQRRALEEKPPAGMSPREHVVLIIYHALEADLIAEVEAVVKAVEADERFLVIDATVGQQAGPQAKAFHDAVGITGVIVTKLDGTAKGGGALSAVAEVKAPIVFIGVGEKIDDLEKFEPPRFISRLLGMGDLETLLERAQEAIDAQKAEALTKKIMAGKFTLNEMYEQIEMLTDMGPMRKLASLIPGMGGKMKDADMESTQARLRRFKIIMDSMTDDEMKDPKLVKSSRVQRIARGAGVAPRDVKELLRNYEMSRKAIKGFAGNRKMRKQLLAQLEASGVNLDES